jgi:hypothetical protein
VNNMYKTLLAETVEVFENNKQVQYMGIVKELAKDHVEDEYYTVARVNTWIVRETKKEALKDANELLQNYL